MRGLTLQPNLLSLFQLLSVTASSILYSSSTFDFCPFCALLSLVKYGFWCIFVFNLLFLKEFFTSKFIYCRWPALLTLGFSGNPALLQMFCIVSHYCHVFESNKYLLRQNRMSFTALLLFFVLMGMRSDGPKSSHDHPCSNLEIIRNISTL